MNDIYPATNDERVALYRDDPIKFDRLRRAWLNASGSIVPKVDQDPKNRAVLAALPFKQVDRVAWYRDATNEARLALHDADAAMFDDVRQSWIDAGRPRVGE